MMKQWSNGTSKALLDMVRGADSCDGSGEGKLIVVAGRPATGVADILLRLMSHVAVWDHRPVGLFSLEMDSMAVVDRLVRMEAEIDPAIPGDTDLSASDFKAFSEAAARIHEAPIYINDEPRRTTDGLAAEMQRMIADHSLRYVVLDYLGLVESSDPAKAHSSLYSKLCSDLKTVAEDTGVKIIVVAKLPRDSYGGPPTLDQLDRSGSLRTVADTILIVHSNAEDPEWTPKLTLAKQ